MKPTVFFSRAGARTAVVPLVLACLLSLADGRPGDKTGQAQAQAPAQSYPYPQTYQTQPYAQPYAQPYGQPYPQAQPYTQPQPANQAGAAQPGFDNGQGPLVAPPITFVDVNSGRFGKLSIDLEDAQFLDGAVDKMHLEARKMDLTQGILSSLSVDVSGGHFQDFTFDRLVMNTQGELNFDTGILFNHRALQFTSPAQAQVSAVISQASLNRFLNSPRTLGRLSVAAGRKAAFLENFLGTGGSLVTFMGGNAVLQPANRLLLSMQTKLGIANLLIPLELSTQLALRDGWIYMGDTRLATSGQEISPQLSQMLVEKVNGLAQWGHRSDDIQFNFTTLKVVPGDKLVLQGTATVRRLRFGRT